MDVLRCICFDAVYTENDGQTCDGSWTEAKQTHSSSIQLVYYEINVVIVSVLSLFRTGLPSIFINVSNSIH